MKVGSMAKKLDKIETSFENLGQLWEEVLGLGKID